MKVFTTGRGFEVLTHAMYPHIAPDSPDHGRLVQASGAVGDYPDSFDRPGTSALWVGENHHLNRDEVRALVTHLLAWLDTGSLELPPAPEAPRDD